MLLKIILFLNNFIKMPVSKTSYFLVIHLTLILAMGLGEGCAQQSNIPVPSSSEGKNLSFEETVLLPDIWTIGTQDAERIFARGDFFWVSAQKNEGVSVSDKLRFFGLKIQEATLRFNEDKLEEIKLCFFDRSASSSRDVEDFDNKAKILNAKLNSLAVDPDFKMPDFNLDGHVIQGTKWKGKSANFFLELGFAKKGFWGQIPSYITLTLSPSGKVSGFFSKPVTKQLLSDSIKSNQAGDVWLNLPMVYDGRSGEFCGPVSLERIMRYYKVNLDRYELGVFAETKSDTGTSTKALFETLNILGPTTGLKPVLIKASNNEDHLNNIKNYNTVAQKKGLAQLPVPWGRFNPMDSYSHMDKNAFLVSRKVPEEDIKQFMLSVSSSIQKGVPIVWNVLYGFVDESPKGPPGIMGHSRVIIGYNMKTKEILYTDSWGIGHDLKHMNAESAYAITLQMFCIVPDNPSTISAHR